MGSLVFIFDLFYFFIAVSGAFLLNYDALILLELKVQLVLQNEVLQCRTFSETY